MFDTTAERAKSIKNFILFRWDASVLLLLSLLSPLGSIRQLKLGIVI